MFTASSGRMSPYSVILPPGYTQPENASKRYPVVYFMHGYGMDPEGIAQVSLIAQNAMVDTRQSDTDAHAEVHPRARRRQVPSRAATSRRRRCPPTAICARTGTFYTDHPEGDVKAMTELMELQDYIDANYRTKAPADLPLTE